MPLNFGLLGVNQQQDKGGVFGAGGDLFGKVLDYQQGQQRNDIERQRLGLFDQELKQRQAQAESVDRGRKIGEYSALLENTSPTGTLHKQAFEKLMGEFGFNPADIKLPQEDATKRVLEASKKIRKINADVRAGKITEADGTQQIQDIAMITYQDMSGYDLNADQRKAIEAPVVAAAADYGKLTDANLGIYEAGGKARAEQSAQTAGFRERTGISEDTQGRLMTKRHGLALERIAASHAGGGGKKKGETATLMEELGLGAADSWMDENAVFGTVREKGSPIVDRGLGTVAGGTLPERTANMTALYEDAAPFMSRIAGMYSDGAIGPKEVQALMGEAARASGFSVKALPDGKVFIGDKQVTEMFAQMFDQFVNGNSAKASQAPGQYGSMLPGR